MYLYKVGNKTVRTFPKEGKRKAIHLEFCTYQGENMGGGIGCERYGVAVYLRGHLVALIRMEGGTGSCGVTREQTALLNTCLTAPFVTVNDLILAAVKENQSHP